MQAFDQQRAVVNLFDDQGPQFGSGIQLEQLLQDGVGGVQLQDLLRYLIFLAEVTIHALEFGIHRPVRIRQAGDGLRQALAGADVGHALAEDLLEALDQPVEVRFGNLLRLGLLPVLVGNLRLGHVL